MTADVAMLHEQLELARANGEFWQRVARRNAILLRQAIATIDEFGRAATSVAQAAREEVA